MTTPTGKDLDRARNIAHTAIVCRASPEQPHFGECDRLTDYIAAALAEEREKEEDRCVKLAEWGGAYATARHIRARTK